MAAKFDFSNLSLDELNGVIAEVTSLRDAKVQERRKELLDELAKLDATSTPVKAATGGKPKSSPKAAYRTPAGYEWSGRGGIPRPFKELGVQNKEDMEIYRIK